MATAGLVSNDPLIQEVNSDDESSHDNGDACCNDDGCGIKSRLSTRAPPPDAPVAGGPRLGKLKGLGETAGKRSKAKKKSSDEPMTVGGIKVLPLVMLILIFGPALLTVLTLGFEKVAATEWGIKMGLSKSPADKLTEFYMKHNPTKVNQVPSLLKKYKGRYPQMFAELEAKYKYREEMREKRRKDKEEYGQDD